MYTHTGYLLQSTFCEATPLLPRPDKAIQSVLTKFHNAFLFQVFLISRFDLVYGMYLKSLISGSNGLFAEHIVESNSNWYGRCAQNLVPNVLTYYIYSEKSTLSNTRTTYILLYKIYWNRPAPACFIWLDQSKYICHSWPHTILLTQEPKLKRSGFSVVGWCCCCCTTWNI